jgi:hypothetical protein
MSHRSEVSKVYLRQVLRTRLAKSREVRRGRRPAQGGGE